MTNADFRTKMTIIERLNTKKSVICKIRQSIPIIERLNSNDFYDFLWVSLSSITRFFKTSHTDTRDLVTCEVWAEKID